MRLIFDRGGVVFLGGLACNFCLPIIRLIPTGASCAAVARRFAVEPQVFDLLIYLVQNRERVVSKDDLFASVWGGRIVADSTLASCINAARKAIGDSGEEQRLIRTLARKGVRFVGAVESSARMAVSRRSAANAPRSGSDRGRTPGLAAIRPARDRRASVRQHERRCGAGIFFRRHQRGHHHRSVQTALVFRHRAQLFVRLQG